MDGFILIGLLIFVFIGIPIGLGFLFYFVPKKLGYPNTAKYLTVAFGLIVLAAGTFTAFEDQFFTKSSAKKLVEEQGFKLIDEFEILNNESMSAIGDYYHTFILKISERDKQSTILMIKKSDNYKAGNGSIETLLYQQAPDRYFGKKIIRNYETENSYVREYFEPSGREGYAPTFRRILISKTINELKFENIDE